jgi:uncharacterized RDD family membrane protein YckC
VYAEPAGAGIRLGASIIDSVIVVVIERILSVVLDRSAAEVLSVLFYPLYVVGFWYARGATPGKMMLGLQIVNRDGSPLGLVASLLRFVGYLVSTLVLMLGFLWIIWDKDKQGWHDKIAGTLVVKTGR